MAFEQGAGAMQMELDRRTAGRAQLSGPLHALTRKSMKSDELFRHFVDSVQDYAIFVLDPSGVVATWNLGAQRIKGYSADEIIGSHFSVFYPADDVRAGKCEHALEVAAVVGRFEEEGWRVRKDGSRFWANVVISAVRDKQGELIGFSKITRDLTERKRSEDERAARLAAEHANRAKDEFLAMLGHELRNPLAPIVTALQLMKLRSDHRSSKEQEVIERQLTYMVRLVDDLLDVSRFTRGKVELKKQRVDVRDAIANAIETVSPLLEQREHRLEVDVPPHPIMLDADEARLTQVFTNLVGNAAKYTNRGGHIHIGVRAACEEVVIDVRDDGIGIDAALLPRVFELFVQGYQRPERAVGGLGLGLTLVRSLVDLHGGTVEAHSAGLGTGSTFTVRLPIAHLTTGEGEAPGQARAAEPSPTSRRRRILIVDDNEDARMTLAEILRVFGHDVRTAGDAPEALEVVTDFTPQVAILDLGLPVMDGCELASRLRAELGSAPRLIALTGYGQPKDRERTREAGFDVHLVKPVDVQRLIHSLGPDPLLA